MIAFGIMFWVWIVLLLKWIGFVITHIYYPILRKICFAPTMLSKIVGKVYTNICMAFSIIMFIYVYLPVPEDSEGYTNSFEPFMNNLFEKKRLHDPVSNFFYNHMWDGMKDILYNIRIDFLDKWGLLEITNTDIEKYHHVVHFTSWVLYIVLCIVGFVLIMNLFTFITMGIGLCVNAPVSIIVIIISIITRLMDIYKNPVIIKGTTDHSDYPDDKWLEREIKKLRESKERQNYK